MIQQIAFCKENLSLTTKFINATKYYFVIAYRSLFTRC